MFDALLTFPGKARVWSVLVLPIVVLGACDSGMMAPEEDVPGFSGAFAVENWSSDLMCGAACWTSSGITGGTTAIDPTDGNSDEVTLEYDVNLGNPGGGVTQRTTTFSAIATGSGSVSFDWTYTGSHAFFQTNAELTVFAETGGGTTTVVEVDEAVSGGFTYSGTTTIDVVAGRPFGVIVGGRNFDSNSRIRGTVAITNLSGPFGGSPTIESPTGDGSDAAFGYDVNLGNPGGGVSRRTVAFSVVAPESGTVSFDWEYTGFHAFFQANAELTVFAETSGGTTTFVEVDEAAGGNGFSFAGSSSITVEAGMPFGIIVGGRNFDSNSRLRGTVLVSNLETP